MSRVCVLGCGAFGTAIASVLADNGHDVNLWCYEPDVAKGIANTGVNQKYFPEFTLDAKIKPETDIGKAINGCEFIFEVVPVKHLRSVLKLSKPYFNSKQVWVVTSKGIESDTLFFPSQILNSVFCSGSKKLTNKFCNSCPVGSHDLLQQDTSCDGILQVALSGPSFAKELMQRELTAVNLAGKDPVITAKVAKLLKNKYFIPACIVDIIGVQIGGALKNVVAVSMGILDGLGCKENTKAFLLSKSIEEMVAIASFFGAEKKTIYGLSGIGDLIATCAGGSSRNFKFGKFLVRGEDVGKNISKDFALAESEFNGQLPEGVNTALALSKIIEVINNTEKKNTGEKGSEFVNKCDFVVLKTTCDIILGKTCAKSLPEALIFCLSLG